jgi:spore maturation protein CgeB
MRAEQLRALMPSHDWKWIDTDAVMIESPRFWQSIAYRFQMGTAVDRVNHVVTAATGTMKFDFIWVDKAIFLRAPTVTHLRESAGRLVHFTPDTAFHNGRSRHFDRSLHQYDLLVTTKSFDVAEYLKRAGRDTVHLTTQGYDAGVHFPRNGDDERRREVAFVGLAEPDRMRCIETLLSHGIRVRVAGLGWDSMIHRHRSDRNLVFDGNGVFGEDYARLLSRAWIGLGLLSKRFPELHTTRTFEIPACGALLATERTTDTATFFDPDEALFFTDFEGLASQVKEFLSNRGESAMARIASRGRERVLNDGRDYGHILQRVLSDPRLMI